MKTSTHMICTDESTQWEDILVCENDTSEKIQQIPSIVWKSKFASNLRDRHWSFTNKEFSNRSMSWYGWYISESEFNRLQEMIELLPQYTKFNNLAKSE